jgi:hypothetical protein
MTEKLDHFTKYLDKSLKTHTLIQDLKQDRALRERFRETPEPVLDGYDLKPEERAALLARDFRALYLLGVHPYLLGQLSRLVHGTVEGAGSSEASLALVRSLTGGDPA